MKIPSQRWVIAALLLLAAVLNYIDMAIAHPTALLVACRLRWIAVS